MGFKADGSIVTWGDNGCGQCNVPGPNSGFVAVAAGQTHSLGLKADGSIVNVLGEQQCSGTQHRLRRDRGGHLNTHLGLKADGSIVAWG